MNKIDFEKLPKCLGLLKEKSVRLDDPVEGAEIKLDDDPFAVKVDCLGEIVQEPDNCKKSYREDSKCHIE